MESRKKAILMALFYPYTLATLAAGLIAFIMLVLKLHMLVVSTVVLWFYLICASSIYLISKPMIKELGMGRTFLSFVITICLLTILSTALLVWNQLGGVTLP